MHNPVFAQRLRVLFISFVGLSFNASLSGYFLQAAHELVDGAPAGMVNATVCEPATALDGGELKSLAEAVPPLCQNTVSDERSWQHDVDREVRRLYLLVSFIGLGVWLALNPVSDIWRSLFRRRG